MPVNPVKLLALGSLSKPSISAEPSLVIHKGHFVTIVCSTPSGYDTFRLEKGSHCVMEKKNTQPLMTEARFLLGPVNESTAGDYHCLYYKKSIWSPRSENLELKVTREDVTQAPDPGSTVNSVSTPQSYKVWIGVRMALAGVVFLVLVAILGEAWHNKHKSTDRSGSVNL
ncbi:leukocyte-associated immunoglobulin-like receptor 1 isoform X2 [Peromyscus leucopus]|uniref:leukocyte-associated immunoglobulin-like receptor 1 isoform X2 n=1 Tax=Peromyscus leucopus TaxID=10041 RepID=UPI00188564B2|nr:leukocyte-associated immunoglobulin-like receptor 1 isoform X2 [Peromyscus leucopus]XP_037058073.1 leukocyte-associated immunoglobulin-like receptor 1 isoform X2 [Peromyscus leucopus]